MISAAFATCKLIDNWVPTVDFEVEEVEEEEEDDESEGDFEVEESGEEGQLLDLDEDGRPLRSTATRRNYRR